MTVIEQLDHVHKTLTRNTQDLYDIEKLLEDDPGDKIGHLGMYFRMQWAYEVARILDAPEKYFCDEDFIEIFETPFETNAMGLLSYVATRRYYEC